MNKCVKAAAVSAALTFGFSASQAQQVAPNDIVLSFAASGVANDYIIDLGNFNSVLAGGPLSGFSLSTYNSTFASATGPVNLGAVGGQNIPGPGSDLFVTQLRTGNFPPSQPGSLLNGVLNPVGAASGAAVANGLALGAVPQGNAQSWTSEAPAWQTGVGVNPMSQITGIAIQEDLYQETDAYVTVGRNKYLQGNWTYVGYLSLDLSGSGSLAFTPVPEPATCGLLAGAGLPALWLRRRLSRKQA